MLRLRFQTVAVLRLLREMSSTVRPAHLERTHGASRGDVSAVTIEAISQLSPTVRGFTIRAENNLLSFKPGQWVDLHIPSVDVVGGYSITSPPHVLKERGVFNLAIQHNDHPPTLWMTTRCSKGDTLSVRVGGDFIYDHPQSHDLLLIAGGVGINPLMAMLLHHTRLIERGKTQQRVKLLYSAKNITELLFKDEIDKICLLHSSCFTAHYYVTRQQLTTPTQDNIIDRRIEREDVTTHLASLLPFSSITSYICGPPSMIDNVTQWSTDSGLPHTHIHTEKWW